MVVSLIVAMAHDRVIGRGGKTPWRLSADLRRFRKLTMGKPIIMGRKTHESIGKVLDGRLNIVLTRNPEYAAPGCRVVHSADAALEAAAEAQEAIVIGGAEVYALFLPLADRMYLTCVQAHAAGDAFFPRWNSDEWVERHGEDHGADAANPSPHRFSILERKGSPSSVA
ncbi:MAG TPA: dihydrofolate reductase [Candidatus Bipolaricaulota bacterium]